MDWFWLMIFLGAILVFGIFVYNEFFKYKHTIVLREIINGRKVVRKDKFKEITDEDKVTNWVLKKEKNKIKKFLPVAPSEAIDVTDKGKYWVEAYRTSNGEIVYIKDTEDKAQPLKPLTSNQRLSLVNNIKKAESRAKKDWKEQLPIWILSGGMIVLVGMLLIFGPDVFNSISNFDEKVSKSLDTLDRNYHERILVEQKGWENIAKSIQSIDNVVQDNKDKINELKEHQEGLE